MSGLSRIFLLLPVLCAFVFGDYLKSYAAVLEQARKENKIGLFMIEGNGCPWCIKMKRDTLNSPEILKELEKDFVIGIVKKDEDITYPEYLRPNFIPVIYFINHKEEVINESVGFKKAVYFMDDIERARYMFESK